MERLTHIADFGMEDWEETLFLVPSDPTGAYNILDIARHQGEPEFHEILKNISLRLAAIEEILGDEYDLDRLRKLKQADDEGRCVVLPFKPPRWVYVCSTRFPKPAQAHYASAINVLQDMDKGCVFGDTQEEAAAALRREQDG